MADKLSRTYPTPRYNGVYIGIVKEVVDANYTGRLKVWIPEMGSNPEDRSGWKLVSYCSPFGGATNPDANKSQNTRIFENTQTSYGFWAVPPDIGNKVLCVFANGRSERGFWIGCLFDNFMNNMVPGIAAGKNYYTRDKFPDDQSMWLDLPLAEYNKFQQNPPDPSKGENTIRPRSTTRHDGIGKQGLIKDNIRGLNTSSARRETPSVVYGWSTPGPKIAPNSEHRTGGHSFVMDDGDGSEYIGLTTKSGAKLKIDETNGILYFINRDGTAWMQFDENGHVDLFGAKSFSVRSQEDINFRADRDINIEAGQNIYMKAAKDTDVSLNVVGEDMGEGGNIYIQALNDEHHVVKNNVYLTVTDGNIDIDIQTGYKKEHVAGDVDVVYDSNLKTLVSGNIDLKTTGYLHEESVSDTTINASNAVLDSGGNLDINATLGTGGDIVSGGSIKASGNMYAPDFQTPSLGLVGHIHSDPQGGSVSPGTSGGGSGGSASASPVNAVDAIAALQAEIKALNDKINKLAAFADETTWFDRGSQDVQTIVERYPTFEPCEDHINKGDV